VSIGGRGKGKKGKKEKRRFCEKLLVGWRSSSSVGKRWAKSYFFQREKKKRGRECPIQPTRKKKMRGGRVRNGNGEEEKLTPFVEKRRKRNP